MHRYNFEIFLVYENNSDEFLYASQVYSLIMLCSVSYWFLMLSYHTCIVSNLIHIFFSDWIFISWDFDNHLWILFSSLFFVVCNITT